jgi:hypothetical protein
MFRVTYDRDTVYVSPPNFDARARASFQRVHVLPGYVNVYRMISTSRFDFPEDKDLYLECGATMPEIERMDYIVRAVVKVVFDSELSAYENTVAIALAIEGALKQEGLA